MTPETRANLSRYKLPETLVLCGVMREENIMHIKDLRPALVSCVGALAAALCCLLPLGVIALGLGSGVFMATTMRYQSMLLPLGVLAVTAGIRAVFRGSGALSKTRLHDGLAVA